MGDADANLRALAAELTERDATPRATVSLLRRRSPLGRSTSRRWPARRCARRRSTSSRSTWASCAT